MHAAGRQRRDEDHRLGVLESFGESQDGTEGLELQDAVGNSRVARLAAAGAQAKLEVGGADDAYEQEADQVAGTMGDAQRTEAYLEYAADEGVQQYYRSQKGAQS